MDIFFPRFLGKPIRTQKLLSRINRYHVKIHKDLKIGFIIQSYNNPLRPNFTKCINKIYYHSNLPIDIYVNSPVLPKSDIVSELICPSTKFNIIINFLSNFIKYPINTIKYILNENDNSLKYKIKEWANKSILVNKNYGILYFGNGYTFIKLYSMLKLIYKYSIKITSFMGYEFYNDFQKSRLNIIFEGSDYLHFLSESYRRKAIELGAKPEKTIVIYLGIDAYFFHKKADYINNEIINDTPILLTTARLVEEKGIQVVFYALHQLLNRGYNLYYWIIGDGPYRSELILLAEKLNITEYVKLIGYKDVDGIKKLLNDADIYIQPSFYENLANATIEAAAMELPVVSSDVGGQSEIVDHGITGILVPPNNIEAMAEAIETLINDPEKRIEMGKKGRQKVLEKFTIEREVNEWVIFYQKLLKNIEDSSYCQKA